MQSSDPKILKAEDVARILNSVESSYGPNLNLFLIQNYWSIRMKGVPIHFIKFSDIRSFIYSNLQCMITEVDNITE